MSYLRTFFERPLPVTLADGKKGFIKSIDFSGIEYLSSPDYKDEDGSILVRFRSGNAFRVTDDSRIEFLQVFEEYCRDMQSLERGPVRMATAAVEMPRQIGEQKTIVDPKPNLNPQLMECRVPDHFYPLADPGTINPKPTKPNA